MEFDITYLDKKKVVQTLFAHAAPLGLGKAEYLVRKSRGQNVDGLTDHECEYLLSEYNELDEGVAKVADYHLGKPMKLNFEKKSNQRILVSSGSYDVRNGKYRFLEAFLNVFMLDEILITKKGYRRYIFEDLKPELERSEEQEKYFKSILKSLVQKENDLGKHWVIDESIISPKPDFMADLGIY